MALLPVMQLSSSPKVGGGSGYYSAEDDERCLGSTRRLGYQHYSSSPASAFALITAMPATIAPRAAPAR
jgi:hypothetical protein